MCGLWAAGRPSSVVATREKSEENKTAESRGKTRVATPGTGKLCQEADPGPAHCDGPLAGLDGLLFESRPPQPLADTATQSSQVSCPKCCFTAERDGANVKLRAETGQTVQWQ